MKIQLIAAVVCGLALSGVRAAADEHRDGHHSWTDQNGSPIQGHEGFEAAVALLPTDSGPAGASARAKIEAENEEGSVAATLSVRFQGLPDGDYQLAVTRASDQSVVTVGQFSVAGGVLSGTGGDQGHNDASGLEGEAESHHQGGSDGARTTRVELAIPADLDPTDIAQVGIADMDGTLLLLGDVGNASSTVQNKATVRLKAGRGAPHAWGTASVQSVVRNGKALGKISLQAAGVPANSTFNVLVNGKVVGRTKSGPRGRVILQNVTTRQSRVKSAGLTDARGRPVAFGNF